MRYARLQVLKEHCRGRFSTALSCLVWADLEFDPVTAGAVSRLDHTTSLSSVFRKLEDTVVVVVFALSSGVDVLTSNDIDPESELIASIIRALPA